MFLVKSSFPDTSYKAKLRLKPSIPLKKDQAWMKTIGIGFGILVLLHLIEVVWINLDIPSALMSIRICTVVQNNFSLLFLLVVIRQIIINPGTFSNKLKQFNVSFTPRVLKLYYFFTAGILSSFIF